MTETASASVTHLLGRLWVLEQRVREVVEHRRAHDPDPDDAFRGLYVSEDLVQRLLAREPDCAPAPDDALRERVETAADEAERRGESLRLRSLARVAGLSQTDLDVLLIAVLPDLDPRFERLYGYLNDDVSRRRATVGLTCEVLGVSPLQAGFRAGFGTDAPLLAAGLLAVEDADRPFLTRGLRVPDRVAAYLLGDDRPDPRVTAVMSDVQGYPHPLASLLAGALTSGEQLIHLREGDQVTGLPVAVAALAQAGRAVLALDLRRLSASAAAEDLVAVVVREARLLGAGIVAGPVDVLVPEQVAVLSGVASAPVPVILVGRQTWDPSWSSVTPLVVSAPVLAVDEQAALWADQLGATQLAVTEFAGHLTLGPDQIPKAVAAARHSARMAGRPLSAEDLRVGVRSQNAAGLERLARRIEPGVGWDDLVLTPTVERGLRALAARARHRHTVLTTWGMRRGGGRGRGITALFGGDSGTGKTMSAEVIAADLGLDLYTVNLATVVDKYVGETEKNLERIFAEASGINAVLFFDEADAIFGKRGEVRDAHDRYANIESAYLLQRLETFDGLAVMATNLRTNIDEAFTRRLDAIIDFPAPTAELRRRLWEVTLRPPLPVADDVDLDFLAESFDLAGGNIRSASTTAAYLAAAKGTPVGMAEVVMAVEQEYRKLGRLVLSGEFGDFLDLLG